MKKNITLGVIAFFLVLQLLRPSHNQSDIPSPNHIAAAFGVPESVAVVLQRSCYDCHSNNSSYPWYSLVQPVGWWIQTHIDEGRSELNFDEFLRYPPKQQHHLLSECIEEIEGDKMPLPSYTWVHRKAALSPEEKQEFTVWARRVMDQITPQIGPATAPPAVGPGSM